MEKQIEKFYLSMLDYAGLKYEDGVIKNKDQSMPELTIDGEPLTLPYFENTKHPNGRRVFHLLNEAYNTPYTDVFNIYKKRLTVEINLRISSLVLNLITIASDAVIQQKITNSEAAKLISNLPQPDPVMLEMFVKTIKESKRKYDEDFIVGFQTKVGGNYKGNPYKGTCVAVFNYLNEVSNAIDKGSSSFINLKVRKKDLVFMDALLRVIFEEADDTDNYTGYSDSKVFRMLHCFLSSTAIISNRLNKIAEILNEVDGDIGYKLKEIVTDTSFINHMQDLEKLTKHIRIIGSDTQTVQSKEETKEKEIPQFNTSTLTNSNPAPQMSNQPLQQQQPQQLSPEDIIRSSIGGQVMQPGAWPQQMYTQVQQPMQPQMYQPTMAAPTQPIPGWMREEMMRNQMVNNPQAAQQMYPQAQQPMQQIYQQPMQQPQMYMTTQQPIQQPMYQQPMLSQQQVVMTPQGPMMIQQPMQQIYQQPTQEGLQINPALFNRAQAPYR